MLIPPPPGEPNASLIPPPPGASSIIVPQLVTPGMPLIMEPAQTSLDGVTRFGSNGIPQVIIVPLQQPQAGLNSIILPAQVPADLPVVVVPQVDTSIQSSFPFTIAPDPSRPGGVVVTGDLVEQINVPHVLIPPRDLSGPQALVVVPQEGKAGVPLVIVPQGTALPATPAPVAPPSAGAPSGGGARSAPGVVLAPGAALASAASTAPGSAPARRLALGIILPPGMGDDALLADQGPLQRASLIVRRVLRAAGLRGA